MAIYLIRHGETKLNAARVVQFPDTPLSSAGEEQARKLAARFRGRRFARIVTSDYARAQQTASALSATTGARVETEPLLRERNFGALRGLGYEALRAANINPFAAGYAPPEGETWDAFHARVTRAWQRVMETSAATAGDHAVITHGMLCRSVVERHAHLPKNIAPVAAAAWANTSVTIIEPHAPFTVTLLNCTRHLDEVREGGVV